MKEMSCLCLCNCVPVSQEWHQPTAVHESVPKRQVWGVWDQNRHDTHGWRQWASDLLLSYLPDQWYQEARKTVSFWLSLGLFLSLSLLVCLCFCLILCLYLSVSLCLSFCLSVSACLSDLSLSLPPSLSLSLSHKGRQKCVLPLSCC